MHPPFKAQFDSIQKQKNIALESLCIEEPDKFLIAPFSAFKNYMKTPVPYYRMPITEVYIVTKGEMRRTCNFNKISIKVISFKELTLYL